MMDGVGLRSRLGDDAAFFVAILLASVDDAAFAERAADVADRVLIVDKCHSRVAFLVHVLKHVLAVSTRMHPLSGLQNYVFTSRRCARNAVRRRPCHAPLLARPFPPATPSCRTGRTHRPAHRQAQALFPSGCLHPHMPHARHASIIIIGTFFVVI